MSHINLVYLIQMNHQDWNQVVFTNNKNTKSSKSLDNFTYEYSNATKLDQETENVKHDQLGLSIGKKIQFSRMDAGFSSQKALATAINVKPALIASYESGKAIPDSKILQKLRMILKTTL